MDRPDTVPGFTMQSENFYMKFITGLQCGVSSKLLEYETDWYEVMEIVLFSASLSAELAQLLPPDWAAPSAIKYLETFSKHFLYHLGKFFQFEAKQTLIFCPV